MTAYNNLKRYIEVDRILVDQNGNSEFEKFCQEHNSDIEQVLNCIDEISSFIHNAEGDLKFVPDYIKNEILKPIEKILEGVK